MATAEINSSNHQSFSDNSCVIQVGYDLTMNETDIPDVTLELYSVVGSIIAMEVGVRGYGTKPMTQFALLMDELIDNEEYVAMLRNAEVINNFVGANQQLAALFNLGKGVAHVRGCKAIDEVRIGLHKYTRGKYKKLWSEFVNAQH
ncbi:hypothetical protein SUGI_1174670 [Cryptomeria japonica]|nr:hypothetical protein SUGI_1174670 [Cryptomeria japonica]